MRLQFALLPVAVAVAAVATDPAAEDASSLIERAGKLEQPAMAMDRQTGLGGQLQQLTQKLQATAATAPADAKGLMLSLQRKGAFWFQIVDGKDANPGVDRHAFDGNKDFDVKYDDFMGDAERAYMVMAEHVGQPLSWEVLAEVNHNCIKNAQFWDKQTLQFTPTAPATSQYAYQECPQNVYRPHPAYQWADKFKAVASKPCWKEELVKELLQKLHTEQLPQAKTQLAVLNAAADFAYLFGTVHPFADGNGRTKVMAMNFLLAQRGMHPVVLFNNNRDNFRISQEEFRRRVLAGYLKAEEAISDPTVHPWSKPGQREEFMKLFPTSPDYEAKLAAQPDIYGSQRSLQQHTPASSSSAHYAACTHGWTPID